MRYSFFLSMMLFASCVSNHTVTQRRVPSVKSAIAQSNTYLIKEFVGLSTPDESVNLAFKVSGQIMNMSVSKGDEVSRGEILAELDPRDFELQLSADQSSYEQAKSRLERAKRLLAHEAVSRQEFESAQSEYVRYKSTYENSKDVLTETKLRAPFLALVERTYVDTYQRVMAGETIVRVVSPSSTTVEFTIPESSLFALSDPATLFEVIFDAYEGVVFDAKLKEYARTSSDASGFPVALTIDVKVGYMIQSGMSCTISMLIAQDNASSVTIPLSAIYAPVQGGDYVWVVSDKGVVESRSVTLGSLVGSDRIVVDKGLKPGERVVTAGVYRIQDGEVVKLLK
ncbi:MAG: efflux RND transporter periplasmic adaptor subunit [Rikenellaceae bacterium]